MVLGGALVMLEADVLGSHVGDVGVVMVGDIGWASASLVLSLFMDQIAFWANVFLMRPTWQCTATERGLTSILTTISQKLLVACGMTGFGGGIVCQGHHKMVNLVRASCRAAWSR